MNRTEILNTAREYVTDTREAEHGDAEAVFRTIAGYWALHLGTDVTPVDVAVMMGLLKAARIKANPSSHDHWIDLAGYAAIGGELALGGEKAGDVDEGEIVAVGPVCPGCGSASAEVCSIDGFGGTLICGYCQNVWSVPL